MGRAEAGVKQVLLERSNSWMLQSDRTGAEIKQHFEIEGFSFLLIGEGDSVLEQTRNNRKWSTPHPTGCLVQGLLLSPTVTSSTRKSLDLIQEGQGKNGIARPLRKGLLGSD